MSWRHLLVMAKTTQKELAKTAETPQLENDMERDAYGVGRIEHTIQACNMLYK